MNFTLPTTLPPHIIFTVQVAITVVVLGYLVRWYIWPFLQAQHVTRSLQWLLVTCVVHHIGIGTLFTNVASPDASRSLALVGTVGDSAVMVVAVGMQHALFRGLPSARAWAWAFTLVGVVYNLFAFSIRLASYINGLGSHYYVLAFYVPVAIMTHILVAVTLVTRGTELRPSGIRRPVLAA